MELYQNNNDKVNRLHNTVALISGEPHYVYASSRGGEAPLDLNQVKVFKLSSTKDQRYDRHGHRTMQTVRYDVPEFEAKCVPLGYYNNMNDGRAGYLVRNPTRHTAVGPSPYNVVSPENVHYSIESPDMHCCIKAIHPTLEEATEAVVDKALYKSLAFDREYAIEAIDRYLLALKHKGTLIGVKTKMTEPFKLIDRKFVNFLKPDLDELGVGYAN